MATNLRQYINNFGTTLDGAVLVGDTLITLTDGSDLPVITGSEFYLLTIKDVATGNDIEIVKVTSRSGNDITVVRAQENTLAFAFADLDTVTMNATADSWNIQAEGNQSVNTTDSPTFSNVITDEGDLNDVHETLYSNLVSGIISGGIVTINGGDNTKWDITAWTAVIVDIKDVGTPDNPLVTFVGAGPLVAQSTPNLGTKSTTKIFTDSTGTVQTQNSGFSDKEERDRVKFATLQHQGMVQIEKVSQDPTLAFGLAGTVDDFAKAVGHINLSGNVYSANGVNVNIDKSEGTLFTVGTNYAADVQFPNNKTIASFIALSFIPRHRNATDGLTDLAATTSIDPDQFDDGSGTLQSVANNKFTVQAIVLSVNSEITRVHYGQTVYDSLDAAAAGIGVDQFEFRSGAMRRAWLIVKKGTTDLSNVAEAKFIEQSAIAGASGSGASGVAAATMQSSYDSSSNPERILDDTKTNPAITTRDSSTPVSSNLYEWQDFAGTTEYESLSTTLKTYGVNIDHGAFFSDFGEISIPANPAANTMRLYAKDVASVTKLFVLDSAGTETDLLAAGGGGDPDQNLWFTINADSGTTNASTITDTLTFTGGTGITTAISGDVVTFTVDTASTTVSGIAELATTAETSTGTDTGRTIPVSALPLQVQDSKYVYAADAGASDTYVITLVPAPAGYVTGQVFHFTANTANTGAATLNVNGLGATAILKQHDVVLADNDIEAGSIVTVAYDGTNFQMLSQIANAGAAADHVITTGSNAPTSTPVNIGDRYVDTNNNTHWAAHGTSAASDWRQLVQENDFGSSLGFMVKKTDSFPSTYDQRTFSNDDGMITISNPDGIAGAPVWDLSFQNGTEESDTDNAADFLAFYDNSAGAMRKANPAKIGTWQLIGESDSSLSGDSVADFAIPSKFGTVVVVVKEIRASIDDVDLLVQMGTDASTFVSINYSGEQSETRSATVTGVAAATNGFMFSSAVAGNGIGTNGGDEGSGIMFITSMAESSRETRMTSAFFSLDATATENFLVGGGRQLTNAAHTHLRLLLSSGTFEIGVISVYGIIGIAGA